MNERMTALAARSPPVVNGSSPISELMLAGFKKKRRTFCRPCLDWTERRFHLAGATGAALAQRCFQLRWIRRVEDSRALAITEIGLTALKERFGIRLERT